MIRNSNTLRNSVGISYIDLYLQMTMKYIIQEYMSPDVELLEIDYDQVIALSGDIDDYINEDYNWE